MAICSGSLRRRTPHYGVWKVVALIWTLSLAMMSPIFIYQDLEQHNDSQWSHCVDNFPSQVSPLRVHPVKIRFDCNFGQLYVEIFDPSTVNQIRLPTFDNLQGFRIIFSSVVLFVGCYFLPLFVITASYVLIYLTVWRRSIPGDTLSQKGSDHKKVRTHSSVSSWQELIHPTL